MSREKGAAALLIALIILSGWNIIKAGRLCRDIEERLDVCAQATEHARLEEAELAAEEALGIWLDAESYSHIFIRHPEIDSCSDVFYELLDSIASQETQSIGRNIQKLRYHIRSIASMERLSPGSIL